ncbi:MAG: hypothetical protein HYV54_00420 [Parcubacteria group bacterium]|nr:hypothetical protein [Parcubacteria group bacterium]
MSKNRVVTKTPHRICLTGGTDLLPYVKKFGGDSFGATIDKFVTVEVSKRNDQFFNLSYPDATELVDEKEKIKNPIIRQALVSHKIYEGLNIKSVSDIPPGSGLGSSGAFTVGLLNALHALKGISKSPRLLAEEAADLEINKLKAPIGKHDQYMAAHGGFLHLIYKKDGGVTVRKIDIAHDTKKKLESELVLVFSGMKRSASETLGVTARRFRSSNEIFSDISAFRKHGLGLRGHIINNRIENFANGLKALMVAKKQCFVSCTDDKLEEFLNIGYGLGAVGAKVIGAGGGGFVYFYVPKNLQPRFKKGISAAGGTIYPFRFVFQGSQII